MEKTYTPLFSEILDKVHKAKTTDRKVAILRENNTDALRMVLKSAFDPKIEWVFPDGEVPYTPNDAPEGAEHTVLAQEARRLWHFVKDADPNLTKAKREMMFIQLLEGLQEDDADLMIAVKEKTLNKRYKGLTDAVVKEAFGWNEDYKTS